MGRILSDRTVCTGIEFTGVVYRRRAAAQRGHHLHRRSGHARCPLLRLQRPHTPAIDQLAAEGIRFTQAYAHTVCCPARAMLMTGRHPQRSDVNSWTQGRCRRQRPQHAPEEVTLAEALQGGRLPDGPVRQVAPRRPPRPRADQAGVRRVLRHPQRVHRQLRPLLSCTAPGSTICTKAPREVFHRGQYFPDLITDRALSSSRRNQDRPFFLYFALNIPHYPEQSLARCQKRYKDLPEPRRSYAAMISTTDDYIGRIARRSSNALKLLGQHHRRLHERQRALGRGLPDQGRRPS